MQYFPLDIIFCAIPYLVFYFMHSRDLCIESHFLDVISMKQLPCCQGRLHWDK